MTLPKEIKLGCFTIKIKLLDSTTSYEIAEQQGSYVERTNTIYLSEDIFDDSERAINVVLHELFHAIYSMYSLMHKDEETVVNSFANGMTELLLRTDIHQWINETIKRRKNGKKT